MINKIFLNQFIRFTFSTLATHTSKTRYVPTIRQQPFKTIFQSNQQILIMRAKSLEELGLKKNMIERLLKYAPDLFEQEAENLKIKTILQTLSKEVGETAILAAAQNPQLLKQGVLVSAINEFKKEFQLDDKQINKILRFFPKAFSSKTKFRIQEKKASLHGFLDITNQQIAKLVVKWPFFINLNQDRFHHSMQFMHVKGFTNQQLKHFLFNEIEIFFMGENKLKKSFDLIRQWGVTDQVLIRKILVQNPKFLIMCPYEMMSLKIKILRNFKILNIVAKEMFEKYPKSLILSVSSLEAKLIFLKQKFKLQFNISPIFPYILTLNYNEIVRPRGQLIVKYGLKFEVEQFSCNDEEFAARNNMTLETLLNEKNRFKISKQFDYKVKFFTRCVQNLESKNQL